jgi:glycosyltransferase involved in cell wall biosynthesis
MENLSAHFEAEAPTPEQYPAPRPEALPRVAMLASIFAPSIGGIQSHTLRLAQRLVARGAEVHVVTRIQPGLSPFERMAGVRVHRVGIAQAKGAAGSVAFVAAAVPILARLAPEVDVLHAHQLLSPTSIGLLAAPLVRRPVILNPHACGDIGDVGLLRSTRLGRIRLRTAVERADAFVAVSRDIRDELLGAGVRPGAIWSIGNGVDTDRFSPATPDARGRLRRVLGLPAQKLVIYAGRLSPEKGADVLLQAWPAVATAVPGARLCLIGNGSEEAHLRAQARALHVEDSALFIGAVPDVAPYLRAADVAVLPSRTEGMPVALLEAMSCALPVVATAVGGSAETLRDGATGRLVPSEDPPALAAALAEALTAQTPGGTWGAAARAHVLDHASMELVADRYVELYRAVVAAWRVRSRPSDGRTTLSLRPVPGPSSK